MLTEDVAGKRHDVEATVDTGFTGFLSLPRSRILTLGLVYRYPRFALLGDGTTILIHLYEATVIWDGQAKIVTVIEKKRCLPARRMTHDGRLPTPHGRS